MNETQKQQEYLTKLNTKEWSFGEFMLQVALWGVDLPCLVEYEVRQFPYEPKEIKDYYALSFEKRNKIDSGYFFQPEVLKYMNLRSWVFSSNFSDYEWLLYIKSYIPDIQKYLEYHLRLDKKIKDFKDWLDTCGFAGREIKNPEVEHIKEVFGGEEI